MSKLSAKANELLFRFFAKLHLVKLLQIMIFIVDTYKLGLVRPLLSHICSSMEHFNIEVAPLRSIFKRNNYPVNIID